MAMEVKRMGGEDSSPAVVERAISSVAARVRGADGYLRPAAVPATVVVSHGSRRAQGAGAHLERT